MSHHLAEGFTFAEIIEFMSTQPEWAGVPQLKTVSTASKPLQDLVEVTEEIKDKKAQLHSLEKRLFALERDKFDLEELVRRERLQNEQVLTNLIREKFARDEHIRAELEARIAEQEAELERMTKRLEQEVQGREEALRSSDALRAEIRALEERIVQDEQIMAKQRETERQLRQDIDDYQHRATDDEKTIMVLRENERLLANELEGLQARLRQMENTSANDGSTIVEMRDTERALRAELEQALGRVRLLDDQSNADEHNMNVMRESIKNLQLDNDNLHAQNIAFETKRAEDMATIDRLRESESTMRRKLRLLDDVTEEVERLRAELEKHRRRERDLAPSSPRVSTTTTTTRRSNLVRSPSPTHSETFVSSTSLSSPTAVETSFTAIRSDTGSPRAIGSPLAQQTSNTSARRYSGAGGTSSVSTTRYSSLRNSPPYSPRSPGGSRLTRSVSSSSVRHELH